MDVETVYLKHKKEEIEKNIYSYNWYGRIVHSESQKEIEINEWTLTNPSSELVVHHSCWMLINKNLKTCGKIKIPYDWEQDQTFSCRLSKYNMELLQDPLTNTQSMQRIKFEYHLRRAKHYPKTGKYKFDLIDRRYYYDDKCGKCGKLCWR